MMVVGGLSATLSLVGALGRGMPRVLISPSVVLKPDKFLLIPYKSPEILIDLLIPFVC